MSAAFTAGPWGIAPETNGTEFVAYSGNPWRVRAVLIRGNFIGVNPNWKADMALIAAAPELYYALKRINDTGDVALDIEWIRRISRAALAKASGMEAATAGETVQQGSTEGDSPTAEGGDARKPIA